MQPEGPGQRAGQGEREGAALVRRHPGTGGSTGGGTDYCFPAAALELDRLVLRHEPEREVSADRAEAKLGEGAARGQCAARLGFAPLQPPQHCPLPPERRRQGRVKGPLPPPARARLDRPEESPGAVRHGLSFSCRCRRRCCVLIPPRHHPGVAPG